MIQKLIDAYELEREMYRKCIDTDEEIEKGRAKWDSGLWIRYKVFEDTITLAPRVDPVKHGQWVKMSDANGTYYVCSECGDELPRVVLSFNLQFDLFPELKCIDKTIYCPSCGAKMENANG